MKQFVDSYEGSARVPPRAALITAFTSFFETYKQVNHPRPFTPVQLKLALETWRYLQKDAADRSQLKPQQLSVNAMAASLDALARGQYDLDCHDTVRALARGLYEKLTQSRAISLHEQASPHKSHAFDRIILKQYIQILSMTGDSAHARDLCFSGYDEVLDSDDPDPFCNVCQGFAWEGRDDELGRTLDMMQKRGICQRPQDQEYIITRFAKQNHFEIVKKLCDARAAQNEILPSETMKNVLRCCIRNSQLQWGETILKQFLERFPGQDACAVAMQWAAAEGRSAEQIDDMLEGMTRQDTKSPHIYRPTISDFNVLIHFAAANQDLYQAEKFSALARKWRCRPNMTTYLIRMGYQLRAGDIVGAVASYRELDLDTLVLRQVYRGRVREHEMTNPVGLLNNLLTALCYSTDVDYSLVSSMSEYMMAQDARLESKTIGALVHFYLHRNDLEEASDLLLDTADSFSAEERLNMQRPFLNFMLDRDIEAGRAWDAYELYRKAFPEAPVKDRTAIMHVFFARKRSDLAILVFGHMRQVSRQDRRPSVETYIQCFLGIASCEHTSGLNLVHNMLKLDLEIELETRLLNSLMAAYAACKMPDRSLQYYQEIMRSNEGPTYSTFAMAFRACETATNGNEEARRIWKQMKSLGVDATYMIYVAYIGAMAGQGQFVTVVNLINGMEEACGRAPDAYV